jgi:hypothetical protein
LVGPNQLAQNPTTLKTVGNGNVKLVEINLKSAVFNVLIMAFT